MALWRPSRPYDPIEGVDSLLRAVAWRLPPYPDNNNKQQLLLPKKVSPYHAGQTIGIEHYGLDAWPRGPPRQEKHSTGMERSAILDVSFLSFFSLFFFSPSHPHRFFVFICRFNLVKFNRLGTCEQRRVHATRSDIQKKLKEIKQKVVSLWIFKKKKRKVVGWALRLMDAFIKRLGLRQEWKGEAERVQHFSGWDKQKTKKEDQDIGSPFLLVRQINKREMMKEKEKKNDIRWWWWWRWRLVSFLAPLYGYPLGCPTIHHPSGALLLYSPRFFHSPNSSQNELGKMKKGEKERSACRIIAVPFVLTFQTNPLPLKKKNKNKNERRRSSLSSFIRL